MSAHAAYALGVKLALASCGLKLGGFGADPRIDSATQKNMSRSGLENATQATDVRAGQADNAPAPEDVRRDFSLNATSIPVD